LPFAREWDYARKLHETKRLKNVHFRRQLLILLRSAVKMRAAVNVLAQTYRHSDLSTTDTQHCQSVHFIPFVINSFVILHVENY